MKKISIVSERNEENNTYEIRTIVIFDDNKAPTVINYEGVQNLVAVANFAEENGYDILGNEGIKPAIEGGLIEIISKSNEKKMSELKAQILEEQLKYAPQDEKTEEEKMADAVDEKLEELKESQEEVEPEEGKITSETTSFEPIEQNRLEIGQEFRDLAEYLRLDLIRGNNALPPTGLKRIEELKADERVNGLEIARNNVLAAMERVNEIADPNSQEAINARRDLRDRKKEYEDLRARYRAELAEAIKNANKEEEVEEGKITPETTTFKPVEQNRLNLSEEDREFAEYLRLNILRAKKQLPPVGLKRIEELTEKNERVSALERARANVISAMDEVNSFEDKESSDAKLAEVRLEKRQAEYEKLHAEYRKQLAEAIRVATNLANEEENKEQLERNETLQEEPNKESEEENKYPTVDPKFKREVVRTTDDKKEEPTVREEENKYPTVDPRFKREEVRTTDDKKEEPTVREEKEENKYPAVDPRFKREVIRTADDKKEENKEYKPDFVLVPDKKEKKAEGVKPVKGEDKTIEVKHDDGKTETIKCKVSGKFKNFLKKAGAFVLGVAAALAAMTGIDALLNKRNKNNNTPVVPPVTTNTPAPAQGVNIVNNTQVTPIILAYCDEYNVPQATRIFLQQREVMEFLSNYKNADQLKEVISALAYGYEANILTTKDGNYRLDKDGNNYLTSFTHDFLCAKAVVNRYSSKQMMGIFGGSDISYEEMMNGFKNYVYTVQNYGMTAKQALPFQYLTNNNPKSTRMLNELQEKLITVNINRDNHTLTSDHTDDFIAKVFEIYVQNDQSLNVSEGAKTVGAALVDAFSAMQAQVSEGEALFLHKDMGLAKAGIHLGAMDGHFTIGYLDQEGYDFHSLYDVMNHGYGDKDETAARCLSAQQELLASITGMHTLMNSSADVARLELANALYQNLMTKYGDRVASGNITEALLNEILSFNPMLAEEVEAYRYATNNNGKEYVGFEETVNGVDRLLGISNRKENNYAALINARRNALYNFNYYTITSGKRYVGSSTTKTTTTGTKKESSSSGKGTVVKQETVTTTEQVTKAQMTRQEVEQVERQEQQLREQEQREHQQQEAKIEQTKEELRQGVKSGKTQEQLEVEAAQQGIELDPHYQEEMEAALREQAEGEAKRKQIEAEVAERNRQAEEEAARRAQEEAARQEAARLEQERLIRESMELDNPQEQAPAVDELDSTRTEEGETPYVPSAAIKDELSALRAAALQLDVDTDGLDIGPGPTLG